jgi:DNA-binding NtrC family response regulator
MTTLEWIGPRPAPDVRAALRAQDLALAGGRERAAVAVVATARLALPGTLPTAGPWLWLCAERVPLAQAMDAVRRGAHDVLSQREPDWPARLAARARELATPDGEPPVPPGFVAESAVARQLLRQLARAAATAMPVLLTGETGTGKEQAARLIHRTSRRPGPWQPINCAAIPNDLMESELFGHARGAFSGAVAAVDGKLAAAQGGTVFLDEIDDTPLSTQMKLLRVLEDGEVTRVGETQPRQVDFRLIAASNRDLPALAARGEFGRDLYERLAIVRIDLPPLRSRRQDLPALAQWFVGRYFELQPAERRPMKISPLALAALAAHAWPGNIRELRNVIFQALVNKPRGDEILLADLPRLVQPMPAAEDGERESAALRSEVAAGGFNLRRRRLGLERQAVTIALELAGGNAARAARLLGEVGRGTASDPGATVRAMARRLGVKIPPP